MAVITKKGQTIARLPLLEDEISSELRGLTDEQKDLVREKYIRDQIALNPKYNVWSALRFFGYKTDITINSSQVLVSIKGQIAYDLDGDMHVSTGDLDSDYPQVSIPLFQEYKPVGVARAIASTFLAVPDMYKGISRHDLEVTHLDGQKHQCHLGNLEWKLNKPEDKLAEIQETVKALESDLPDLPVVEQPTVVVN